MVYKQGFCFLRPTITPGTLSRKKKNEKMKKGNRVDLSGTASTHPKTHTDNGINGAIRRENAAPQHPAHSDVGRTQTARKGKRPHESG